MRLRFILLFLLALGVTSLASAQPVITSEAPPDQGSAAPVAPAPNDPPRGDAPAPASDPNAVTPPKLVTFVAPVYPEAALSEPRAATVTVMLVIGLDGHVESAELVGEPQGQGFDEAALAAARQLVFEPALKAGQPLRARLGFRFEFTPPPPPAPPPEGELSLTLLDANKDQPLAGVEILLSSPTDPSLARRLVTDASGKANSGKLPAGDYELIVRSATHAEQTHREQVVSGESTELRYRLTAKKADEDAYGFGAVARVKAPPREVTRRTIEREELTRIPGTRGDALRTIELLPGVSRPPLGAGFVLIRGAAPGDSMVLLDGVPVPLLYHFGGLTSFINSRALERIDFYPGNFSVRYGRQIGGIIDVGVRDPSSDRIHAVIDANAPLDSSVLVEGPINDKVGFMVGARRSYFGEVLTAVIPKGTFDAFAAPVYWDYQSFVTYKPNDKDRFRLGAYGASDALEVLFAEAPDQAPEIQAIEVGLSFHRAQFGWRRNYSPKLEHDMQLSYGRIEQDFYLSPDLNFDLAINQLYARAEWRYRFTEKVQATLGMDGFMEDILVTYRGPQAQQQEGDASMMNPLASRDIIDLRDSRMRYFPASYLELAMRPTEKLRIVPGLRVDYFEEIDAVSFDPRIAGIYSLSDTLRLKAGVGMFSQAPEPQESSPTVIGNPKLDPIRAIHTSAGFEQNLTDTLSIGVEGFYKHLYDRVVSNPEAVGPTFINDGVGRIYGLEVSGRKNATGRWFGFLSYTLMRSERNDRGEGWRLFDFDQTHLFTTAVVGRLGRGWELGGTVRIYTGNPRTPLVGGQVDLASRQYSPVVGALNSTRAPTFNRLDVRVEKTWKFQSWKLAWYLDVQNIYNAENPEGKQYSFDYTKSTNIRGLPIIPILGLRAEL